MRCPVCNSEHLVRSDRSGIEPDYCPKCRLRVNREELERETEKGMGERGESSSVTDNRPPLPQDPENRQG